MAEKVIVAVHGIGEQSRYATIQAVAYRLAAHYQVPGAIPLGRFHEMFEGGLGAYVLKSPPDPELPGTISFAEVYWAGFPRQIDEQGYTLEESKRWARTIVARVRMRAAYRRAPAVECTESSRSGVGSIKGWGQRASEWLSNIDYLLLEAVLEEIIDTVGVIERLVFLADRAGLFTFDLKKVLTAFVGDVQIVTEFKKYRSEILDQFKSVMQAVHKASPAADIYIIAHSEGTVVAFLGLLIAMATNPVPAWIPHVKGLMTLGSPIDTHMILWPDLWDELRLQAWQPTLPIKWRNYYDYGDPIGDRLDTAREWLKANSWTAFEFEDRHDFGFSRYYLPGKAHVDYWEDPYIFGHFIESVVEESTTAGGDAETPRKLLGPSSLAVAQRFQAKPPNLLRAQIMSYLLPYGVIVTLFFLAVYILYRSVNECLYPDYKEQALSVLKNAGGLALLLAGITVVTRIPRLSQLWRWRIVGAAVFLAAAYAYTQLVELEVRKSVGAVFTVVGWEPTTSIIGLAIVIAVLCSTLARLFPFWGVRSLPLIGGAATLGLVVFIVVKAPERGAVWPVVLSGAGFLYLWWLAALLFDLTFVWHRYIRHSVALSDLQEVCGHVIEKLRSSTPPPDNHR